MNLLYKREIPVTDKIKIVIPSVGEILEHEAEYLSVVNAFTCMPIDMIAQLDEAGIDFDSISPYELFLMLFGGLREADTSLVLGDLDLKKFDLAIDEKTSRPVLLDRENDIVIDRIVYMKISDTLRLLNNLEKNRRKPANKEARDYMLERARLKQKRNTRKPFESQLEPLIIAMVNTEQFKYDYDGTRELSIYQFYQSVRQIIHKVEYDNRMIGVYSGTVSTKSLNPEDFNWLTHK